MKLSLLNKLFMVTVPFLLTLLFLLHIRKTSSDLVSYQQFIQENQDIRTKGTLQEPFTQQREGVSKDIWMSHNGKRLHSRIESEKSELLLTQKNKKIDGIEKLENIKGWIQLQGEMSFVMADLGTMCIHEKTLLLDSIYPNRVLFQQPHLAMSAPQILIGKTAQAVGDVRFFLNTDEITAIQAIQ